MKLLEANGKVKAWSSPQSASETLVLAVPAADSSFERRILVLLFWSFCFILVSHTNAGARWLTRSQGPPLWTLFQCYRFRAHLDDDSGASHSAAQPCTANGASGHIVFAAHRTRIETLSGPSL